MGGDGGSRFKITIPVVAGTHTVDLYYKTAEGIEIVFRSFTITSPKAGDSAENPLYVKDSMTAIDMAPFETVYLYIRNANGMVLSTDSYVSIVYNGQEYPAGYDVVKIVFDVAIGEGALVAVTASEWGSYACFTLSEYVPPVNKLPYTTEISTDGWTPGEVTIVAPATGTITMTGGDNCAFLLISGYMTEWLGDGTAKLEVVEGQTYVIGITSANWSAATFTVTFAMAEATEEEPVESELAGSGTESDPYVIPGNGEHVEVFGGGWNPEHFYSYTATVDGTLSVLCTYNASAFWSLNDNCTSNPMQSVEMTAGQTVIMWFTTYGTEAADIPFTVTFTAA